MLNQRDITILDFPIDNINMPEAVSRVEEFISKRTPHQVITANTLMLNSALRDPSLKTVFNQASLVVPDSVGLVWAARALGHPLKAKVPGIDLLFELVNLCLARGYSIYLLGAKPGVAAKAAERLQTRFPGLKIAGTRHGYFARAEETAVIEDIQRSGASILFVGFSIPYQELWINAHLAEINIPVCIGVGGSFDVICGRIKRAPQLMQKLGLEWLWRTLMEPWRIKRIILIPVFILRVYRQKWLGNNK